MNIRIKFGSPHHQGPTVSSGAVKGKLRIACLLTIEQDREVTIKGFGQECNITLKCLGLTQENKIR